MNVRSKLATAVFALGALVFAAASQAVTPIAELPLKASVLAKPNVVFGMDDSGSMDAEVMIDGTFQGWFYADYGNTTLYPAGKLRTGSGAKEWPLMYLFPDGTGAGNRVYSDPTGTYGYAIPPTPEMAWTRSSSYNTIYYDSMRTYAPWSPAYVSGASVSYAAAPAAAARSHPALGATTLALNANVSQNVANWRFTFIAGMTIPAGAAGVQCTFAGFPGVLPYTVPTSRGLCTASLSYYPATFWRREACVADGTSCVTNFDGQTLKRYEIKNGNSFPSGRSYADEMQNFANWFTYYRKRRLMLGAAMGQVLESMTGLRMGVVPFNANAAPTMYDADALLPASNRLAVIGRFYTNEGDGGTPTHATMAYIHNQFDTNANIIQYACQRNASFLITDGFANDPAVAPPAYSQATYGAAAPYQSIAASSLADKALAHFTRRLRAVDVPLPAGKVPLPAQDGSNPDPNPDLHLNTYALTLGMKGTLWPTAADPFATHPAWPVPTANTASMIDDLWHATINGRGQMYGASDAAATATAIRAGLLDILRQPGAQGGLAVSTVNLQRGDSRAYMGGYNPSGWTGDLTANAIDTTTGATSPNPSWSASALLTARNWTTRVIASSNGAGGVGFTSAAVGALVNPGGIYGNTDQVMNYLRGDRSLEGSTFRARSGLMGAVINADPATSRDDGVVYVASGEGMLHAFDTRMPDAGKELWAFVPRAVLADIGPTTQRAYAFRTQLDGTPVIGKVGASGKLLVAGMGVAGRSYYALDVSSPRELTEADLASKVKWEFPAAGDAAMQAKVGQTLGLPVIVRLGTGSYAVLVTSGYNNLADGRGRLWMLDPDTGAVLHEFDTGQGTLATEAGLAQVSPFVEDDGSVRYVYGGDLLGNLWRFDLHTQDAPARIAVLKNAAGQPQPVTTQPELLFHADKRIVLVGTGRLLDISDFGSSAVQSMYAVADGPELANARASLVQQTFVRATDSVSSNAVDWSTQRGWFMDMPAGEQINTRPVIVYGLVAWVTNVAGSTDCSAQSYLYVLNVLNGQRSPNTDFASSQISATANSSGVTALLTGDPPPPEGGDGGGDGGGGPPPPPPPPPPPDDCQRLVGTGQDSNGGRWTREIRKCVSIVPSKNAWREIRF